MAVIELAPGQFRNIRWGEVLACQVNLLKNPYEIKPGILTVSPYMQLGGTTLGNNRLNYVNENQALPLGHTFDTMVLTDAREAGDYEYGEVSPEADVRTIWGAPPRTTIYSLTYPYPRNYVENLGFKGMGIVYTRPADGMRILAELVDSNKTNCIIEPYSLGAKKIFTDISDILPTLLFPAESGPFKNTVPYYSRVRLPQVKGFDTFKLSQN